MEYLENTLEEHIKKLLNDNLHKINIQTIVNLVQ